MIVVNLKGGLGNQMFQYALGLTLSHKTGSELKLDLRYLQDRTPRKNFVFRDYDLDIFAISPKQASKQELKRFALNVDNTKLREMWLRLRSRIPTKASVVQEKRFSFDSDILLATGDVYLNGYWQSERYFSESAALVRQHFVVSTPLKPNADKLLQRISSEESVCLNVRRADFVGHSAHKALEVEYFKLAVGEMERRIGQRLMLFVFSDDVEWCRNNLQLSHNQEVVDHRYAGPKFCNYFLLMSTCKHFIIPNSTFAWWAAWLAKNPKKVVIGPKRWIADPKIDTKDVLPEGWIAI